MNGKREKSVFLRTTIRTFQSKICQYVSGDDDALVVTLDAGLETVLTAEAVLESARSGETVRLARAA